MRERTASFRQLAKPSLILFLLGGAALAACTGTLQMPEEPGAAAQGGGTGGPDGKGASPGPKPLDPERPFEAVSPRVYVGKVKNLLLGEVATAEEIAKVEADPSVLGDFVDAWFVRPEAQTKFASFYQKAFQQTQIGSSDFADQLGTTAINIPVTPPTKVFDQAKESMARTAQKLIADGKSFTETVTTHTFMMTPLVMSLYLALDQIEMSDAREQKMNVPVPDGNALTFYVTYREASGKPDVIPLSETLNPASPNYLHFGTDKPFTCSIPKLDATGHAVVAADGKTAVRETITYRERTYRTVGAAFLALQGVAPRGFLADGGADGPPKVTMPSDVPDDKKYLYTYNCQSTLTFTPKNVTADDNVWRLVTIRAPQAGEKGVPFYDLPALRGTDKLVLRNPRVGFFTTPAFFANWATNQSNQQRNTLNQALIVALGRSINPVDRGAGTVLDNGKDGEHSDPTSPCYSCHQTMDPMRNVFRRAYTYTFHAQNDASQKFSTANFDYLGATSPIPTLDDFARALIKHPVYASAWVQKLCFYANSSSCVENDPEFLRVAKAFEQSNFNFQTLVRELFTSPLVTNANNTKTWQTKGEVLSVARTDHLCATLTNRLNLTANVCTIPAATYGTAKVSVENNIPFDGYLRGAEGPALTTDVSPFYRGALESLCQYAADLSVDKDAKSLFQSVKKDAAITGLVTNLMGIPPNDESYALVTQALSTHFDKAVAAGAARKDAMKSTFVVACLSPTTFGMGL